MCDCAHADFKDDATEPLMKFRTIFQNCSKLHSNREDYIDGDTNGVESICRERKLIVSNLSEAEVPSLRLSSSASSNASERRYKFVNRWQLECGCPIGDEGEDECEDDAEECISGDRTYVSKDLDDHETLDVECTLAIIKPEAVENRRAIENRIIGEGFAIEQTRWLHMTAEQVSEFYVNSYSSDEFAHLVAYMSSGSVIIHVLAKKDAVREWRSLMGPSKVTDARMYFPDSIRALYGRKGDIYKNAVHGSASREDAQREIHFFFPEFIVEPLLKGRKAEIYLWEINKILTKGLALSCQLKPTDPILWLANWLIANNPNAPKNCNPTVDTVENAT